ncbi:hypothetical protein [Desulfuribacillus alkaliarsenatis]|uniref:Chemotaxis methyl-accepting receptor HlyB-like 4HB MCP domain-containing protein n=1 Tax=Desulfuribacillus alkaliarsenatis TaxID=766136 RepID=A0A1E5FYN9_9FIRM|nr:hypothetical protein [Desulfuribacillus alkaliarsenatis]OEF95693.1 hypothetical protein BHF68_11340 [Desulfuribacillus alkaliarsenatis]
MKNKASILIGILVISLLGNSYLITKLNNYQNTTEIVRFDQYTSFFNALRVYSANLDYLLNEDLTDAKINHEISRLQEDVNALVSYARSYGMLHRNDKTNMTGIIWDLAMSSNWIYQEYLLNIDSYYNHKKEVADLNKIINEIVRLENNTYSQMRSSSKGFDEKTMSEILYPKAMNAAEMTILAK